VTIPWGGPTALIKLPETVTRSGSKAGKLDVGMWQIFALKKVMIDVFFAEFPMCCRHIRKFEVSTRFDN
jgi:hypothetical protein